MTDRYGEALAIYTTHGLADTATTVLASIALGASEEPNPLVRELLQEGVGWAVGTMLLVVGVVAIAWPQVADAANAPRWVAVVISIVGLAIAVGNLLLVVLVV